MRHRVHIGFRGYVMTWVVLLVLTGITFGLSFVHTGDWGIPIALFIASTKSLLVALFFMHLAEQGATNRIVAAVGILFLALLIGLMVVDVRARARPDQGLTASPRSQRIPVGPAAITSSTPSPSMSASSTRI